MQISQADALAIVSSESFQQQIIGPMIDEFVRRLSRPGADGKAYRAFIQDWLYFERPMLDRFIGERFNVQFEGPALSIDGAEFPLGGFILRELEWVRIDPVEAFELRSELRKAVDEAVIDWIGGRPMKFLPATVEKPFPDRAAADAETAQIIRDFLGSTGKTEGVG
ncbi:hypothetical protein [Croceicoccus sp. Ery15]|uniref:hypothetical protein n=1 Tax=Croceicoccus sp. Ery15 TaxID=1703338 RepID=UPI001E2E10FD|nr:hypothetical protein [Croceicoccus sp. Ery15]